MGGWTTTKLMQSHLQTEVGVEVEAELGNFKWLSYCFSSDVAGWKVPMYAFLPLSKHFSV